MSSDSKKILSLVLGKTTVHKSAQPGVPLCDPKRLDKGLKPFPHPTTMQEVTCAKCKKRKLPEPEPEMEMETPKMPYRDLHLPGLKVSSSPENPGRYNKRQRHDPETGWVTVLSKKGRPVGIRFHT